MSELTNAIINTYDLIVTVNQYGFIIISNKWTSCTFSNEKEVNDYFEKNREFFGF